MNRKRILLWLTAGLFVLLVLLPILASYREGEAIITVVPLGWFHFLGRNLSEVTLNWGLIGSGILYSLLILVVGHWLLKTVFHFVQLSINLNSHRRWRWQWTLAGYLVIWLLLIIALGSAGVYRHTIWLMQYDKPWYEPVWGYGYLPEVDIRVREMIDDHGGNLVNARKAFFASRSLLAGYALPSEDFDVIFYGDQSNNVAAYLVIPRDRKKERYASFCFSTVDGSRTISPLSKLSGTISNLDQKYLPQ